MAKKKFEIKTRIMSQANGSGKLTLTVKNGWRFWYWMYVENTNRIREYLKSDEFKEFAYSVFSKYEGMTDEEMYNTDRMSDFQKIWDKLNIFAWRTDEEQFKIKVSLKLSRTHGYGFTYRVEFGNNKDNRRCWFRRYLYLSYIDKVIAKEILGDYYLYLCKDKAFNDKLATYKTWDEFYNDINDDVKELTDDCLMRASLAA